MNKLKIKKGFTLVELIIVITILVILATIAFVSFQNYTKDARDSNRLMSIKNIQNGLEGFQIKTGIYPEPENSINILAGASTITKQGYFGESQSDIINIDKLPLDPLDGTKYIYSINNNKNKYQLLSYLEANSQLSFINETYADDLSKRNIKSFGNKLGIILDLNNNPIKEPINILSYTGSDLKVFIDNKETLSGTGLKLASMIPNNSCERIFESGYGSKDGIYQINDGLNSFEAYCSKMSTQSTAYSKLIDGDFENMSGDNWSLSMKKTSAAMSGSYGLEMIGGYTLNSNNFIYVDTNKTYKIEGYAKSSGVDLSKFHFGFVEYDENKSYITSDSVNARQGTETTLSSNVNPNDTSINFNCDDDKFNLWKNNLVYHSIIAFEVDDSGNYSDLPNKKTTPYISNYSNSSVSNLLTKSGNVCTFNFNPIVGTKAGVTYPAGTKIRMHHSGGYNYSGYNGGLVPNVWTKYSGQVSGVSSFGTSYNKFRKGTKYIRIVIISNNLQTSSYILNIDNLKFEVVN